MPHAAPDTISVVIPVVDEVKRILSLLDHLQEMGGFEELIVADGESTDGTPEVACRRAGVTVVSSTRGRACQMNTGAAAARGDVLLFLHADVRLPAAAPDLIRGALALPGTVGGAFRIRTVPDERRTWFDPLLRLADVRARTRPLPYGDQAIFCTTHAFRRVGGYPLQPLFEDVELGRRLQRVGRLHRVRQPVRVSGRRFQARPVYYTAVVNAMPLLYRVGVKADTLARLYAQVR